MGLFSNPIDVPPVKGGGPAFPTLAVIGDKAVSEGGLTLRDYFATHASDEDVKAQRELIRAKSEFGILPDDWPSVARYMHADAMLKARAA